MYQVDFVPTVKKYIKASELPRDWIRDFPNPKQVVLVTITNVDPELDNAASLAQVMDVIGERAQQRGLTREILRMVQSITE